MARVIVLDSTPLGLACDNPRKPAAALFSDWLTRAWVAGAIVVIPEIADYKVRRNLILEGRTNSLARLDRLQRRDGILYAPLSTAAIKAAAEIWAASRRAGLQTAENRSIDADVIVVAQARFVVGSGDDLTVATGNVKHLSRFVDARRWEDITL